MSANILIIDDDPDIGLMMKMMLDYKGYIVTVLENADQAEENMRSKNIDLVFMDMLLSGVNGVDLCAIFKKDATLAPIPIIMMSAHPDAKNICLQAGADDFIFKPFDMREILSKIKDIINKNGHS